MTPTEAQRAAADPAVSAWVGANAGSGKTRVLTHRVARLLLEGAPPERILCLTYTRAAAAEMQNRLFELLGRWAMADDATLGAELAALEGAPAPVTSADRLARARRLFARALETPGGLKIQTIHAFCDAILRRFPLEAGVSPGFELIDDRQAAAMIAAIREAMAEAAAEGSDDAFDRLAARLADTTLDELIGAVKGAREGFPPGDPEPLIEAHFGHAGTDPVAAAFAALDWDRLKAHAALLQRAGGMADRNVAAAIAEALAARDPAPLVAAFLTGDGARRSRRGFPVKAVLAEDPAAGDFTDEMLDCCEEARDALNAAEIAARTRDLHAFAGQLLSRYEAAKAGRAMLDYDDLIGRTRALLATSEMAGWVLYKLDAGIDHVLVDEAQDTAPGQWEVIDAIVSEFQAGLGAREGRRTLFVVGDEKQSIYSFQGARPAAFGAMRARNAERLEGVGERLARPDLVTSFRSAPAVLRFVDALFAGDAAAGLTSEGAPPEHVAHRKEAAGRVDLWPLITPPENDESQPWHAPVDRVPPSGARPRLARALAREVARLVAEGRLPGGRRIRPGDILILVTRRDSLARGILRALKAEGVPVAGADRMRLPEELAVMDLMALMQVAVTPGDDLSLAALLRSPLCGLSEEDLFALAHGREGSLWRRVLEAGPRGLAEMLRDMAASADYLRPYEFLERALIRHDGRRRLLARLGQEAEDPIDELLAQALAYEAREAPGLTGFIDWQGQGGADIRREMEAGRDEVRLMTVHGAKGLEAPLVILPDTLRRRSRPPSFLTLEGGNRPALTVWPGGSKTDDRRTAEAREVAARLAEEENRRLLYVAATRAEDWLILCGAGAEGDAEKGWYGLMEGAMGRLGAEECPAPEGFDAPMLRLEDTAAAAGEDEPPVPATAVPPRPVWLRPAPPERVRAREVPSALVEEDAAGGAGVGRAAARLHGEAVHLLLERLGVPGGPDPAAARRLLDAAFPGLDPEAAIAEAARVLAADLAREVFAPGTMAEVTVSLEPRQPGHPRMIGRIDRIVPGPEKIIVIDYKTDAAPPGEPAGIARPYLAQMASYVTGAQRIFAGRQVAGAFLWTAVPRLMTVPPELLSGAAGEPPPPGDRS